MSEGRSGAGVWVVLTLLVGGVGCIGALVLAGAFAGAGFFFARSEVADIQPHESSSSVAPAASGAPDAGLPFCTRPVGEYDEEQIQLYVQLMATRFTLSATDGTHQELPYEGEAYPYAELRAQLADRRMMEPNRRDVFVTSEPGVAATVPTRVVQLAREVGFSEAVFCRMRTETDDLLLGNAPGAADDNFGFGGLGLRGGDRDDEEGTIGLGNLGTIGDGTGSGYGRGAGGLRGRSARIPRVRAGTIDVRGSLSREVIRHVIRRHINEVRFCYEQELNTAPELEGNVTVTFIISPSGSVLSAAVSTSTVGSARVESCITQAVRRWSFPAPDGGGVVGVNQTFALSSAPGRE